MARAVADVLADGGVLLAEAGTGTGKTMAYLVPAILERPARARLHRHEEPAGADLLQGSARAAGGAAGVKFTATYMKGRANYLCLHRFDQARAQHAAPAARSIAAWAATTETGDRAELEDLPDDSGLWNEISATADTCLGSECPQFQQCFVTPHAPARRRIRRRHRQSPSAVRRRGGAPELLRRGDSRLPPLGARRGASARGRRDAVLRACR